nr:hypothetical protein [Klebsiella sp. Ap-874]
MLLSVFIRNGYDLYCAPARSTYPRSAPYVCSTLYDVRWEHPCPPENPRPPRHKNDHALCPPRARSSGNGPTL